MQGKGGGGGNAQTVARMTINDSFLVNDQRLWSDGKGPYADWRLEGGDPCVIAKVENDGLFFVYFYRGSDLGDDCNEMFPGQERTYRLQFPQSSGICAALGLGSQDPCALVGHDRLRFRADDLFAKSAQSTPVGFLFFHGGQSYALDSQGLLSGTGDTRTVTNATETGALRNVSAWPKSKQPVGSPFVFPFQFTVERVAQ
jgi:hypothetical protein